MNSEKIKDIKIENFIWIIYFFIVIAALASNHFEEEYVKKHQLKDYQTFKKINITIFTIAFFIYLYFVYFNYKNISNLKKNTSKKKVLYSQINLIAAILFLVGGTIYLFTESTSNDFEEENIEI